MSSDLSSFSKELKTKKKKKTLKPKKKKKTKKKEKKLSKKKRSRSKVFFLLTSEKEGRDYCLQDHNC